MPSADASDAVQRLLDKGVRMPNPATVTIGDDVDADRISGDGVTIHPGCRLSGAATVISAGCELGREGPVTIEDCRLGPKVALKGGYAAKAVFLEGANVGLGHHIREGCLLEEESGGAHTVGLKQTILFPFATLGSLINFCDCLLAGGTSRSDHSEVGSSYIHFNFTPSGDKTTPSLFGDVPAGVMLRSKPIFLGGQGGAVGPVRVAYGSIVGAGSVIRADIDDPDRLTLVAPPPDLSRPFDPHRLPKLAGLVAHNVTYLANLDALEAWYRTVRLRFFAAQPLGDLVAEGALAMIASGRGERLTRLRNLGAKLNPDDPKHAPFAAGLEASLGGFGADGLPEAPTELVDELSTAAASGTRYVDAVKALPDGLVTAGTQWLSAIVAQREDACAALIGELGEHFRR
ncbi:UDP-N-acetylglucosamine pyrophosphorylase [Nigerium massiliense]|uniref:UDP-N-acetylglucosamine pyrophosphorylase n=1 Tax=Nigerium massiliense TaxID=1522317 RepID=UPI00058E936A|nr:UDP-N-acetylglucosamine pyrophosphorylase [Nigerium massiliense]